MRTFANHLLTILLIMIIPSVALSQGEVTRSGNTWTSTVNGRNVYTGNDMIAAIQAAANNLTSGRRTKQTVNVRSSGSTGTASELKTFDIPSYTVLDFHGNTMHVNDEGNNLVVPVRGIRSTEVEIVNMRITGNPRYGIWLFGVSNVIIRDIHISIPEATSVGLGIRVEGRNGDWSRNVTLDNIYAEHCQHHAVEIWDTDGLTIGTIETRNTGGCGLLLNSTRNATIESVNAFRASRTGGYAGFRTANNCGPNIHVKRVVARECGRGIFGVSQSRGITIDWVDIEDFSSAGILIEDCRDYTINGGIIRGTRGEGVRIASRIDEHQPAQNVTIQNLCIRGTLSYGIRETSTNSGLGNTNNNLFQDNDLRGSATNRANEIAIQGSATVARRNCLTGGTVFPGCSCENEQPDPRPLDCNNVAGGTAALDACGVCTGGNTNRIPCTTALQEGTFQIRPLHSDLCLRPADEVSQQPCVQGAQNTWQITRAGNNYYFYSVTAQRYLSYGNAAQSTVLSLSATPFAFRLESAGENLYHMVIPDNTDLLADIEGNYAQPGRNVLLWTRTGRDNQVFRLVQVAVQRDCHGEIDGVARVDDCGICSGGNTQKEPCTAFIDGAEACSYEGLIETEHTGFAGSGYLNGDNALGNSITWSIRSASAITGKIAFRYANGSNSDRTMELLINGERSSQTIDFAPTGAWHDWAAVEIPIELQAGINQVQVTALTAGGGPNFDLVALYDQQLSHQTGDCLMTDLAQELKNSSVKLYPVPANGTLTVEHHNPGSMIKVFDMYGNKVSDLISTGNTSSIDVSYLAPGVYQLIIQTGKSNSHSSFVVH